MEGNNEQPDPIREAKMEVLHTRQKVALMGANDVELPAINAILDGLESGEISPEEAVREANKILESKADDH
ncbi:MAG TPA: hypothetical protein VJ837_02925 [Candidatus Paceibacterota bacterium]|nr:hypothetical protein [Candidatus Paceibacterota bacterium]